jgi:predicted transcriptional regulator
VYRHSEIAMSTTTIRIDDELKERIAAAAQRAGKTAHSFMVEAIAQVTEDAERNDEFHQIAGQRWAKFLATGEAIPWGEARGYLEARARGEKLRRPRSRKVSR